MWSFVAKGLFCIQAKWPIRPGGIICFCSLKRPGVFLLPPGWDAGPGSPHRVAGRLPHNIKFISAHLSTWLQRGTLRVKCLAQEHNTMSLPRARTQTARTKDERTNHEATVTNRPFARCGHMIRNKLCWDANNAVGLSKQRNSYQSSLTFLCFVGPTALFASHHNLCCTMWPDRAKSLLSERCSFVC